MSFSLVPGFDPSRPARLDRASLLIESCCTTLDEALSAQSRGADRIELCVDLSVGGVTPPRNLIRDVVAALTIPVNVLVRPAAHASGAGGIVSRAPANVIQAQREKLEQSRKLLAQLLDSEARLRKLKK